MNEFVSVVQISFEDEEVKRADVSTNIKLALEDAFPGCKVNWVNTETYEGWEKGKG